LDSDLNHAKRTSTGALSAHDLLQLTTTEFITLLKERGIEIQERAGRLAVSASSGAVDDVLRAELQRRKTDLLERVIAAKEVLHKSPLIPGKRGTRIPLTMSQQGMWLVDHFDPGNVAYNIPEAFASGHLDLAIVQKTVDLLIARHEIFRTGVHEQEGELYQSIEPEAHTLVGSTDLTTLSQAEADAQCARLITEYARRPFDLRHPPLLRFHVFRVTADRDVLFLNIHHIIADRQSLLVLREEFVEAYQALAANTTPKLPHLSLHYADYAVWASEQLLSSRMKSQIEYWRLKLKGLPPHLELPLARPYPSQASGDGDTVAFELPSAVGEALAQIGRDSGATPYMTFLAVFALMIARFSGQQDFCIGSPFTQRTHVETQRMIGLFMNMVAFRVQFTTQQSFRDLLRQVRATALEAYEHSDAPFQTLVRALRFNRRSARTPIFQVMFGFDPASPSGIAVSQIDTRPGTARYDLSLVLADSTSGILSGYLEYRSDLFERTEISSLVKELVKLAGEVAEAPDLACFTVPPAGVVAEVEGVAEEQVNVPPAKHPSSETQNDPRRGFISRLSSAFSSRSRQ
jgi:Condensation domain/TubC N-terminal docking domain